MCRLGGDQMAMVKMAAVAFTLGWFASTASRAPCKLGLHESRRQLLNLCAPLRLMATVRCRHHGMLSGSSNLVHASYNMN